VLHPQTIPGLEGGYRLEGAPTKCHQSDAAYAKAHSTLRKHFFRVMLKYRGHLPATSGASSGWAFVFVLCLVCACLHQGDPY
jgi:hypothetical protein